MSFRVVAIPTSIAATVRDERTSPGYGHPAHAEVAGGYGPCRHCLRAFKVGEETRLLFTYDPFAVIEELPLPGPVFIHEEPCERYAAEADFPEDLKPYPLTLNAYARGRELRAREYVTDAGVEAVIERLLERSDVDYIHVRDTDAGCFDLLVER